MFQSLGFGFSFLTLSLVCCLGHCCKYALAFALRCCFPSLCHLHVQRHGNTVGLHVSRPSCFYHGSCPNLLLDEGRKDQREEQICTDISSTKERKRGCLNEIWRAGFAVTKGVP